MTSNELKSADQASSFLSIGTYVRIMLVGVMLGVVLAKSDVSSWQRVNKMFLFQEAHMYLIIGTGIVVAMLFMFLLKKIHAKFIGGGEIKYKSKPFHKGVMIGGAIFGAGWAITGACPGPIYTQIGGGELYALITLGGALLGMFGFALLKPKLPF